MWRLGGAGRGCGSLRSYHLARAKALVGFLRQKPGQVREKTGPGGPAFLVPLPLVFSSPCFLDFDRFRFLTTLLGSTQTPASNTDLSVTQWPTAPSALSSSPSSPSSLVRGRRRGEGACFPFLPLFVAPKDLPCTVWGQAALPCLPLFAGRPDYRVPLDCAEGSCNVAWLQRLF